MRKPLSFTSHQGPGAAPLRVAGLRRRLPLRGEVAWCAGTFREALDSIHMYPRYQHATAYPRYQHATSSIVEDGGLLQLLPAAVPSRQLVHLQHGPAAMPGHWVCGPALSRHCNVAAAAAAVGQDCGPSLSRHCDVLCVALRVKLRVVLLCSLLVAEPDGSQAKPSASSLATRAQLSLQPGQVQRLHPCRASRSRLPSHERSPACPWPLKSGPARSGAPTLSPRAHRQREHALTSSSLPTATATRMRSATSRWSPERWTCHR